MKRVYIFDFDVNLLHLKNHFIKVVNNSTNTEEYIDASDWAEKKRLGGYSLLPDSFDDFEDDEKLVNEGVLAFQKCNFGPSWQTFYDAVKAKEDIAIISARGNSIDGFKRLFNQIFEFDEKAVNHIENGIAYYPVTNPDILKNYPWNGKIEEIKGHCFIDYLSRFNENEEMQIGFSDDDILNIDHLYDQCAKTIHYLCPKWSFYFFYTANDKIVKQKITEQTLTHTFQQV